MTLATLGQYLAINGQPAPAIGVTVLDANGGASPLPVTEQARSLFQLETNTPLGANGVFTGPVRDAGASPSMWNNFTVFATSYQASAALGLQIHCSFDQVGWTAIQAAALTAGGITILTAPIVARYWQVILTNGAAAETGLMIASRFGA